MHIHQDICAVILMWASDESSASASVMTLQFCSYSLPIILHCCSCHIIALIPWTAPLCPNQYVPVDQLTKWCNDSVSCQLSPLLAVVTSSPWNEQLQRLTNPRSEASSSNCGDALLPVLKLYWLFIAICQFKNCCGPSLPVQNWSNSWLLVENCSNSL